MRCFFFMLACAFCAMRIEAKLWSAFQVAFKIIEEELGQPLESLFSKISSETIAAASLGQVYRATLRATGEDVAIKVRNGIILL